MKKGTYKAVKDTNLTGLFSMSEVLRGQVVVVSDGDHEDTVFVECGPFSWVEVYKSHNFESFELLD